MYYLFRFIIIQYPLTCGRTVSLWSTVRTAHLAGSARCSALWISSAQVRFTTRNSTLRHRKTSRRGTLFDAADGARDRERGKRERGCPLIPLKYS